MTIDTTERACRFGDGQRLAGIVTAPAKATPHIGCVLVSAGLVPKFGPFRLYTLLARELATRGVLTVRFDLGGIGDSRPTTGALPLRERTAAEIRAAVDHLESHHGISHVALCGLCSGAEDAFRYAEHDSRVTAIAMIDPFAYRTAGWQWRHLVHRASRRAFRALGVYEPHSYHAVAAPGTTSGNRPLVKYRYMPFDESSRILAALLGRGVRVHFVYTGGVRDAFNHRGQIRKMFRRSEFAGHITVDHFPNTEHTQLLQDDRAALVAALAGRLGSAVPGRL